MADEGILRGQVIEEETDEDIARMAGVINQEIAEESTVKVSRSRLPWLIAGLFGGLLAAVVIYQFESLLKRILVKNKIRRKKR